MRRLVVCCAFVGFVIATSGWAEAYCRSVTGSDVNTPVSAGSSCPTGLPLYWSQRCVGYNVDSAAGRNIPYADLSRLTTLSFDKWMSVRCAAVGGQTAVSMEARDVGGVACHEARYNTCPDAPNNNVIMVQDDTWPQGERLRAELRATGKYTAREIDDRVRRASDTTIALTTISYNPDTGEMYDADLEVNAVYHTFSVGEPNSNQTYDLESVLTHEVGHFLGLAHSQNSRAAMFANYETGSTQMRTLSADDAAGLCAAFPPNGTRVTGRGTVAAEACSPTPRRGFSKTCGRAEQDQCGSGSSEGCAVSPATPTSQRPTGASPKGFLFAAGVVGFAVALRQARSKRTKKMSADSR